MNTPEKLDRWQPLGSIEIEIDLCEQGYCATMRFPDPWCADPEALETMTEEAPTLRGAVNEVLNRAGKGLDRWVKTLD